MEKYRFKASEIEDMKGDILLFIMNEDEEKTAWRLRLTIEAGANGCYMISKKRKAKEERRLALYKILTKGDLPGWVEDPGISWHSLLNIIKREAGMLPPRERETFIARCARANGITPETLGHVIQ